MKPTSSRSRPERHFHDSFITARLAIARVIASWLTHLPPEVPGFISRAPGLFRLPVGPLTQWCYSGSFSGNVSPMNASRACRAYSLR
jgi:hypothetical protein